MWVNAVLGERITRKENASLSTGFIDASILFSTCMFKVQNIFIIGTGVSLVFRTLRKINQF